MTKTRDNWRCANCAAFDTDGDAKVGLCRRHAPVVILVPKLNPYGGDGGQGLETIFPETSGDGWCMEFVE